MMINSGRPQFGETEQSGGGCIHLTQRFDNTEACPQGHCLLSARQSLSGRLPGLLLLLGAERGGPGHRHGAPWALNARVFQLICNECVSS